MNISQKLNIARAKIVERANLYSSMGNTAFSSVLNEALSILDEEIDAEQYAERSMSNTPRTEAACWNLSFADVKEECLKLERELNEANAKIIQMEETADHFKGRAEEFAEKLAEYECRHCTCSELAVGNDEPKKPTDERRRSVLEKIRTGDAENAPRQGRSEATYPERGCSGSDSTTKGA